MFLLYLLSLWKVWDLFFCKFSFNGTLCLTRSVKLKAGPLFFACEPNSMIQRLKVCQPWHSPQVHHHKWCLHIWSINGLLVTTINVKKHFITCRFGLKNPCSHKTLYHSWLARNKNIALKSSWKGTCNTSAIYPAFNPQTKFKEDADLLDVFQLSQNWGSAILCQSLECFICMKFFYWCE